MLRHGHRPDEGLRGRPALLQDYVDFSVTAPPAGLEMTGEQYWNVRGRGFGGEPNGENTTSCAEENLLGYPRTRYFGQSICVHEFSHGIMRGAIYTVDPEYRRAVEDAYAAARTKARRASLGRDVTRRPGASLSVQPTRRRANTACQMTSPTPHAQRPATPIGRPRTACSSSANWRAMSAPFAFRNVPGNRCSRSR